MNEEPAEVEIEYMSEVVLTFPGVSLDDEGHPYPFTEVFRIEFEGTPSALIQVLIRAPEGPYKLVSCSRLTDGQVIASPLMDHIQTARMEDQFEEPE